MLNKLLSQIIDNYALYRLHKDRSQISHYKSTLPIPVDEVNEFYAEPKLPILQLNYTLQQKNYMMGYYKYESEVQDNGINNRFSIGTFYQNLKNDKSINIILVHGWRMENIERLNNLYLKDFLKLGYNVYHFTLPYHFERNSNDSLYNGELMISADIDRTLISIKQAVSDLRALICWLKENGSGKVILIGISLGGFITNLTSVIDKKIDALISVMYANSLAYSVWHTVPGKYIKEDFMANDFTYDKLKQHWALITPSLFKPQIPKDKILLFSGLYDKYVVKEDTDLLWESWERPKRIIYDCGHAGIVLYKKTIAKDTVSFISELLF